MFSITLFSFSQRVPIITIGKDGEFGFGNNYVGNTNPANRLMALIGNLCLRQGLLKHNLNGSIYMRLGFLCHSFSLEFCPCFFAKSTMLPCFIKLCLAFRCPYSSLMASGHKFFSSIRVGFAPLINSPTFNRAKLLASFVGMSYILATLKAFIFRCITPTSFQIASPRAVIRYELPAIKGIKGIPTSKASLRCFSPARFVTHIVNIAQFIEIVKRYCYTTAGEIEEKYCEIAAKRCSQGVMRLDI